MLISRTTRIAVGVFGGILLIFVGLALVMARMSVFPWWYKAALVGKRLGECSSYQKDVYMFCGDPRADLGLAYTDFQAEREMDGRRIAVTGWWVRPAPNERERGTVVLVHGGGADRRAMLKHVLYLHAYGYHALLIDCHNHGLTRGDGRGVSFGHWESYSVIAAAEWAKRRIHGGAHDAPIFVLGVSQGAMAALRAAAHSSILRGVVAESPFVSARRLLEEFPAFAFFPGTVKKLALAIVDLWLGEPLDRIAVAEFAERIGGRPVLLIHGARDEIIAPEHSREVKALLKGPSELWLVPDARHEVAWNSARAAYEAKVLNFLLAATPAAPRM
jgi:hypothetical protein